MALYWNAEHQRFVKPFQCVDGKTLREHPYLTNGKWIVSVQLTECTKCHGHGCFESGKG